MNLEGMRQARKNLDPDERSHAKARIHTEGTDHLK
jgi:hypothetical protein